MPGTGQGVPEAGESPGCWPLFFGIVFEVMLLNGKRRAGKRSSVSRFGTVAAGGCTQWPEVSPGKMVMPQHGEGSSTCHNFGKDFPGQREMEKERPKWC